MRRIDKEFLSDVQDTGPKSDTRGRFFDAWHLECFANDALPDASDFEYHSFPSVTGKAGRDVCWLGGSPQFNDCPSEDDICVISLEFDTRFPAIARITTNDREEKKG